MSLAGNIPSKKEKKPLSQSPGGGLDYTVKEDKEERERKDELLRQKEGAFASELGSEVDEEEGYQGEDAPITSMSDFDRTRELNRARGGGQKSIFEEDMERDEFESYLLLQSARLASGVQSYEAGVAQGNIAQGAQAIDGVLSDMNDRITKNKDVLNEQKDFKRVQNSMDLLSVSVFLLYGISWLFKITVVLAEFSPIFTRAALWLIQGSLPLMGKTKRWRSFYQQRIMDNIFTAMRQNPVTFLALIKNLINEELKIINKEIGKHEDNMSNLEQQAGRIVSGNPQLSQYWNTNRPSGK